VVEWFPQIITFFTFVTGTLDFIAIYARALLWSNLVKAVKFYFGILGLFVAKVKQLVFAGFATTTTLQVGFAESFRAFPYSLNILLFI